MDADPKAEIENLRAQIAEHDRLDYKEAQPRIDDQAYDRLKEQLADLETAHPQLARSREHKLNLILNLIILLTVSAYIIFMKYYEPMLILILFLLMKTNLTSLFLNRKNYIYLYNLYFVVYLLSAIINSFYLFSKNI